MTTYASLRKDLSLAVHFDRENLQRPGAVHKPDYLSR